MPALNCNGGIVFETYLSWIKTIFVKFIMNLRSLTYVIIHLLATYEQFEIRNMSNKEYVKWLTFVHYVISNSYFVQDLTPFVSSSWFFFTRVNWKKSAFDFWFTWVQKSIKIISHYLHEGMEFFLFFDRISVLSVCVSLFVSF